MKSRKLIRGIVLGAISGVAVTAGILLGYPYDWLNSGDSINDLWLLCGWSVARHHALFYGGLGLVVGGVLGGIVGSRTWTQRMGFGCVLLFLAGIALGVFRTLARAEIVATENEAQIEFISVEREAFVRYLAVRAVEMGTSEALQKFHSQSRTALTNYLLQAERFKTTHYETFNGEEWVTNFSTYQIVKKYLADH